MASTKDYVITFVRHAESCGNAGIPYEHGFHKDDPPLSPTGLLQAERLAASFQTDNVTKIYSSSLIRAVQTAYPVAEKLSMEIILLPDLMETGTGISGADLTLLKNKYPLAVPCIKEPTPTGGTLLLGKENSEDFVRRGKRCLDYFHSVAKVGDHIMVVSHGSYFGYLVRAALGIGLPESFCWQVDNCSMTRVIYRSDGIPKLSFANYTGHLTNL